jgi:hypothetical protein
MKTYKGIVYFWLGTMFQIGIICCLIAVLRLNKVSYSNILELIFLTIGGLSSAIWGCIILLYFYIVRAFEGINNLQFLLGLLSSSFILGAIYYISRSLWLCVMYHALLNTFSQTLVMAPLLETIITTVICVFLSVILVRRGQRRIEGGVII